MFFPDAASGDFVGITQSMGGLLFVPQGYASGAALSDSMTFNNATFASLGVTPGTYVWTWGTGADQRFTLQIGSVGVPGSLMAARQFLCSAALCSAWLACGAS
jgi:hypothetical protein